MTCEQKDKVKWLDERTWREFQECGLIWWLNRMLHLFGWAIVLEQEPDGNVIRAYPARCRFRGFDNAMEHEGFIRLSKYLQKVGGELVEDSNLGDEEH